MATKQKVTLAGIVDVRGTVYGPGQILVSKEIADILIGYHEGVPGEVIADTVAELANIPASELTAEQLQQLVDHKAGQSATGPAKPVQPLPPAPEAPQAADSEQQAVTGPVLTVAEGGAQATMDELMKLDEADLRGELAEAGIAIPDDVTEKVQLAAMLADARAALDENEQPPTATQPPVAEPPKGPLPAGFPARAKLIAAGLSTVGKVKEATELPSSLTQQERDQVAAELATMLEA